MQGDWYKPGAWNAICDVCGFRFKSDQLKKNWKGLMVCEKDYETRHPQEFLRVRKEKIGVPWARPEGEDQFLRICWIWERTGYADLATADCAQADNVSPTYEAAFKLKWGDTPPPIDFSMSSIPGFAMPGFAIPGVVLYGV